jgi:integrase
VEKKVKCAPSVDDVKKVLAVADQETQDYLWVIWETMARMGEINRLTWNDVNLGQRYMVLYTRKKKGGRLTPRKVLMNQKLYEILSRRYANRDKSKPWVFWHTYWSSKTREKHHGPYQERSKIMRTFCKKAGVNYFRFHALRYCGASIMDNSGVPIGSIQRIPGHENRKTRRFIFIL